MNRIRRCAMALGALAMLGSNLRAADFAWMDGPGTRPDAAPPPPRIRSVRPPPEAVGNNAEALATARSLLHYLRNYLPAELSVPGVKVNLRLEADDESEQQLDSDGNSNAYRGAVKIAYLVLFVPGRVWRPAPAQSRRRATVLSFPLLRGLYPNACLYLTVFDGQMPVANANWKPGLVHPVAEVE